MTETIEHDGRELVLVAMMENEQGRVDMWSDTRTLVRREMDDDAGTMLVSVIELLDGDSDGV